MVRLSVSAEMAPNYDPATQPPEAEPLDTLFSRAYDFACSRPFTAAELHSHLLQRYPLSPEPAAFEEMLPRILECISVMAKLKHGRNHQWGCTGEGYDTAIYAYVEDGEQSVSDSQVAENEDGDVYADYTGPPIRIVKAAPTAPTDPTQYRILDFDYYIDEPVKPVPRGTAADARSARFEAPPQRYDLAFNAVELARSRMALDRLSWVVARSEGVRVGLLVRHMLTPGMRVRPEDIARAKTLIARMWIRQVVRRDVSDPNESRIYLPADFPSNEHRDFNKRMSALYDNLKTDFSSH